jgi:glycosyltransferase involved in cell wall biosynthesis
MVWDVHEDFVASVGDRRYIAGPLRPAVAAAVRGVQRLARRRCHVILAEDSYAERFPGAPVVPNTTWVPAEIEPYDVGAPRAVYLGRLSRGRATIEMIELGRLLAGEVEVVLIGAADADVLDEVKAADQAGHIRWIGPRSNPEALRLVRGAAAGISLLHDTPNYRHSRPTKIVEYLAQAVPVVTTPLPLAVQLIEESGAGEIVPFGEPHGVSRAAADAVRRLAEPERRSALGAAAQAYARENHDWAIDGRRFVELLEGWALSDAASD